MQMNKILKPIKVLFKSGTKLKYPSKLIVMLKAVDAYSRMVAYLFNLSTVAKETL